VAFDHRSKIVLHEEGIYKGYISLAHISIITVFGIIDITVFGIIENYLERHQNKLWGGKKIGDNE